MRIGLFTDGLSHLHLGDVLGWCRENEVVDIELGVGGYSSAPHVDLASLVNEPLARDRLAGELDESGCRLVALNASGNPLHPDVSVGDAHDAVLRNAVRVARLLGVNRVVAMSGCPGGPGGGSWPVFAGGAWLPDMEGLWDWQWEQKIAPYWRQFSRWASVEAPDVTICLELHPGTSIYNAESFALLCTVTEGNVLVNLDPSHFWWQGIDPLREIEALAGRIGFAHGKDTIVHPGRVAVHGVLDFRWPAAAATMPWHFCAVGAGHTEEEWCKLLAALRRGGYDGVVSIEHEDPDREPEAGIALSLAGLRAALNSARDG